MRIDARLMEHSFSPLNVSWDSAARLPHPIPYPVFCCFTKSVVLEYPAKRGRLGLEPRLRQVLSAEPPDAGLRTDFKIT